MPSPKNISSTQPFVTPLNAILANGTLTFDLSQTANIIGNGSVVPRRVSVTLDVTGKCPTTAIWFNDQLNPSGTTYLMQVFDSSGNLVGSFGQIILSGASVDLSTLIPVSTSGGSVSFAAPVLTNPSAQQTINGFPLVLEGASLGFSAAASTTSDINISRIGAGVLAIGNAVVGDGQLNLSNIRQGVSTTGFSISDNLGVSHFFISGSSPYVNTFIQGNGAGSVFLGSAAKASVADTTGNIVTAGNITLQNTSQLLPGTIANDTLGGFLFTTNAGKGWQIANSTGQLQGFAGVSILLQGSSSGGITLVVPAAAGSNTLTFPAATDTLIAQALAQTITNKRVTPRLITTTSAANAPVTLTADSDNDDVNAWVLTGTAGTLTIAAPSGTPTDGQKLILRIKTTNAWTYSFNVTFAFSTSVTAPTTTGAGKTDYIGCMWNATNTKWDVVAVDQGH